MTRKSKTSRFCSRQVDTGDNLITKKDPRLSKSDFRRFREAPRHLWAKWNECLDASDGEPLLGLQGEQVEILGRKLIEEWILPQKEDWRLFWQETCLDGPYFARLDALLVKDGKSAVLYEIKSSTSVKLEDLADVAFQALILQKHYTLEQVHLILIDNSYVLAGNLDLTRLLKIVDVTGDVMELLPEVEAQRAEALQVLTLDSPDSLEPCWKPDDCICLEICHPSLPEFSIFDIPRIGADRKRQLIEMGIRAAGKIPASFKLSAGQRDVADLARSGVPRLDLPCLRGELNKFKFPLYFLDYETCSLAVPYYEGYKPYQQMVFQYSLHRLDGPALEPVHFEHLSGVEGDPSLSLLASLKNNLGEQGTVIAWHASFESARNREMGGLYPQYAGFMEEVNDRIYDLKEIVSKGIYQHPGFKGSNSIKDVLPVMVPELSYTDLEIHNGSQASFGWWQLAFSNLDKVEREMLVVQMLAYCRLDTLAMVEFYRRFAAFAARG